MEKKIDLETLKEILRDHVTDDTQADILKEVSLALNKKEVEKTATEKEKIQKKGVVILTSLPEHLSRQSLTEIPGFFTEIPLEDSIPSLQDKINDVKAAYSLSRKAKKNPAHTVGELLELASAKLLKEYGILKKPKETLQFTYIPNKL
jgi:hypothetical protein